MLKLHDSVDGFDFRCLKWTSWWPDPARGVKPMRARAARRTCSPYCPARFFTGVSELLAPLLGRSTVPGESPTRRAVDGNLAAGGRMDTLVDIAEVIDSSTFLPANSNAIFSLQPSAYSNWASPITTRGVRAGVGRIQR